MRCVLLFLLLCASVNGWAFELKVEPVVENVYAMVGEIGPRTAENHGLNNTLGFVVTEEGVVLIRCTAGSRGTDTHD